MRVFNSRIGVVVDRRQRSITGKLAFISKPR